MSLRKNVKKYAVVFFFAALLLSFHAQAFMHGRELEGFHFSADYLGWKAQEDQLQYALLVPGGVALPVVDGEIVNFNFVNQHFSFDSGVRLQAGYSWCDSWDACVAWTHFRENSCGAVTSDSATGLLAILFADPGLAGNIFNFASAASSRWKLHFDTITADIGKHYDVCDTMGIDLYGGIAGARIHQRQNVAYTDLNDGTNPLQPAFSNRCNNFSGVGPHVGIDTQWFMCSNVAFISSVSAALLVGKFCGQSANIFATTEKNVIFPLRKHRVRSWFDLALGLEWQPNFCNCMDFKVHIDFEAQYLPEQWQAVGSTLGSVLGTLPSGGHLTTYGVTLGFDVLF